MFALVPDQPYDITYHDPRTGDAYEQAVIQADGEGKILAPKTPIMHDGALVVEREDSSSRRAI